MPFHTVHRYFAFIRCASMPDRPGLLSRSLTAQDLLHICDPYSVETAQAYLRSEVLELSISADVHSAQRIGIEC